MQTVADPTASRKPTAFYATLHGLPGVITKPGDAVLFLARLYPFSQHGKAV